MYTISTKSWHYRLVKALGGQHPSDTNLCEYARQVLLSLLLLCGVSALLVVAGLGIISFFIEMDPGTALVARLILGAVSCGVIAFLWLEYDMSYRVRCWWNSVHQHRDPTPGPILTFLRDKHAKVCRPITYKE